MSDHLEAGALRTTRWLMPDQAHGPEARGASCEDTRDGRAVAGTADEDRITAQVEAYYEQYGELAFRFLVHGFRHRASEAAEAVQDTFVKLLEVLRQGDPIEHPKAWIFTVAERKMLDRLRHGRHAEAAQTALATARTPVASAMSSEAAVIRAERRAALSTALMRMTPHERRRFCLRICAGLTLKEIGALEGTDLRRVGQSVARSVRKIQAALAEGHTPTAERPRVSGLLTKVTDAILAHLRDRGGRGW